MSSSANYERTIQFEDDYRTVARTLAPHATCGVLLPVESPLLVLLLCFVYICTLAKCLAGAVFCCLAFFAHICILIFLCIVLGCYLALSNVIAQNYLCYTVYMTNTSISLTGFICEGKGEQRESYGGRG